MRGAFASLENMITVYGEGLVDLVPSQNNPLSPLVPALGGGPFNVAVVLARQGAKVAFQSRVSEDNYGDALIRRLEEEGVDTSGVQRGPEPTTLAVTTIDQEGSASYNFYCEGTADRLVEPAAVDCDIACFGTCSLAWEPGASRYIEVLHRHAAAGRLVALDPNIRPDFATDAHRERLLGLLDDVNLLKLSEEEVEFFGGIDRLRVSSVEAIVTTRGGAGLSLDCGELHLDVPAHHTEVSDTIGAGDTIMGSLLAAIERAGLNAGQLGQATESQWHEILTLAAAAAAITCSRTGAQPPTLDEVAAELGR